MGYTINPVQPGKGAGKRQEFFHPVKLRCYPHHLEFKEVEPILRVIESYLGDQVAQRPLESLRIFLEKMRA